MRDAICAADKQCLSFRGLRGLGATEFSPSVVSLELGRGWRKRVRWDPRGRAQGQAGGPSGWPSECWPPWGCSYPSRRWLGSDLGERERGLLEGGHRSSCRCCPRCLAQSRGLVGKSLSSSTDFQMPDSAVTFPVTSLAAGCSGGHAGPT